MGNTTLTGSRGWEPERRPPVIAAAALKARSIHTPKNCYTALLTYLPTGSSRLRHHYSKRLTYLSIFPFLLSLLVFSQPRRFICVPLFPNLLSAPTHFTPPPLHFSSNLMSLFNVVSSYSSSAYSLAKGTIVASTGLAVLLSGLLYFKQTFVSPPPYRALCTDTMMC